MPNYTADSVLNQTFDATNTALNANLVASTAYIAPTTHVTASDIGAVNDTYVHSMPTTNNTGTCIWYFDYFYSPVNAAPVTGSTLSATATMTENQLGYDKTVSLGTIPGSGVKIGDFIIGTLRRTPLGDTYPDDMALKQIAAHCQLDTIGSRQRYAK